MICDPSACNQSHLTFFVEKPKIIQESNFFQILFYRATQNHLTILPVYKFVKNFFKEVIQKKSGLRLQELALLEIITRGQPATIIPCPARVIGIFQGASLPYLSHLFYINRPF